RAKELLGQLAVHHVQQTKAVKQVKSRDPYQLYLFDAGSSALMTALKETDIDALTPMQAFDLLRQWKKEHG
ncbi:MAG: hypothetical protein ACTHLZ_03670, partial [Tepidisphaeraceae bacterium]